MELTTSQLVFISFIILSIYGIILELSSVKTAKKVHTENEELKNEIKSLKRRY